MTDQTPNTTSDAATSDEAAVEPTRLQTFVNNHPRLARGLAITGAVVAVGGVATVANTVRKNKAHVVAAADHATDAVSELSSAVSPDPSE